jgi:hypothetical protein
VALHAEPAWGVTGQSFANAACADPGHSLGGALATLAAYDLVKRCPQLDALTQVRVCVCVRAHACQDGAGIPVQGMPRRVWRIAALAAGCAARGTLGQPQRSICLPAQVSVYTFGAPRAGNRSFARVYEATVPGERMRVHDQGCSTPHPQQGLSITRGVLLAVHACQTQTDTWHLINSQDTIPRGGK